MKSNIILKTMKNLLFILPVILIVAACGGTDDSKIKKTIVQKKQQIVKIEQQIAKLEKQLSDTTENIRLIPVEVKDMQPEEFNHYIIVYGKVEADNYALISPEMNGQVESIPVSEGQVVSKGQLLLSLNTAAIEGQIKATKSSLELAQSTFEKQEKLWDQNIGSEMQYLQAKTQKESLEAQLEALEAQMRMSQIRAPFSGTVNKIYPKIGEMAGPGMPVVEFVNLSKITIRADVSESYIGQLREGELVEVSFSSLPDVQRKTPIVRASKVINNQSRTFEIELQLNNPGGLIKPNMVSTIHINDFKENNALVVPSIAIRKDITGSYVYIAKSDADHDVVAKKYIQTSTSYEDQTMVTDGLAQGDQVITKGFHMVSSGIPVRIVQ